LVKSAGDPITGNELASLTQLGASGRSISDLTGLELCSNLGHLDLDENNISDISVLSSLTNVTKLYLTTTKLATFRS